MGFLERLSSEWAYIRGAYRALRKTTSIARNPSRTIRDRADEWAQNYGDRPALESDTESLSYRELNAHANQYARWAMAQGWGKGDVVALLMPNCPEYVAIWLGFAKAGIATALLNINLTGSALAHGIKVVGARAIVVDAALEDIFNSTSSFLSSDLKVIKFGDEGSVDRLDHLAKSFSPSNLTPEERVPLTIEDHCLYIFTSGTTGLPKAANMNHYRVQLAMLGFAGLSGSRADDRVYIALPMYHTVGGLCATGAALTVGASCFIREKFSARDFWREITEQNCTIFAYVGELCRYLVALPDGPYDRAHKVRVCFGNGLRADVFTRFRDRFNLPHIYEFYAATEGNISIINFDSKPGAVGRIPKWMERKFVVKIVRFDIEAEAPVRDEQGRCIECSADEVGEAIGQILNDPSKPSNRFEGYADKSETEKKILRHVFQDNDAWFRSGDLMRKDSLGYFYFIDRIGDTFRWKGENVSTMEVSQIVTGFDGVQDATVYGVKVNGYEGRAGMVSLVVEDVAKFDLAAFRAFLAAHLPVYAQPAFLRFQPQLEITSTFKQRKIDLAANGFDPSKTQDLLYFNDVRSNRFVPIDGLLYDSIMSGETRI